jgi:hypothetical protein
MAASPHKFYLYVLVISLIHSVLTVCNEQKTTKSESYEENSTELKVNSFLHRTQTKAMIVSSFNVAMPGVMSLRGVRRHDKKKLFVMKSDDVTFIVHYYYTLTVNHLAC